MQAGTAATGNDSLTRYSSALVGMPLTPVLVSMTTGRAAPAASRVAMMAGIEIRTLGFTGVHALLHSTARIYVNLFTLIGIAITVFLAG